MLAVILFDTVPGMPVSSLYALESRIDLYAVVEIDPRRNEFQAERIVSYDDGSTWTGPWMRNATGTFRSSLAGAVTGDSIDSFLVGRGLDNGFYASRVAAPTDFSSVGWARIGSGVFSGKPAVVVHGTTSSTWAAPDGSVSTSYAGVGVRVFGRGSDDRMWWAYSNNGGEKWDMAWDAIGDGRFTSSPAAATSADGKFLAVFGKGNDNRIWWAYSTTGGNAWDMAWSPIGEGVFTSAPAACCSADGKVIHVFGRGKDNRFWRASTNRGTAGWDLAWAPIGEGVFTAQPAAACSWDGKRVHVFGRGNDNRIWQARSFDGGSNWNIAWRKVDNKTFPDI